MKQVIIGGYHDAPSNALTEYNTLSGGHPWASEGPYDEPSNGSSQVISTAGVLKNLYVKFSAAPGVGKSYTFTVMLNDIAQSLAVTISDAATTGSDTTHSIAVVAGDKVQLRSTPSGTPNAPTASQWSVMFEGNTDNESLILGCGTADSSSAYYVPISHGSNIMTTTESLVYQVIPTNGAIKNLYVRLSNAPAGANGFRCTLRKNGASTNLTCTITGAATTGNDITHSVDVVAGDYVDLMLEPVGFANSAKVWSGMTFVAAIDGESLILGQSGDTPSTAVTEYNHLTTSFFNDTWTTTEEHRYQSGQVTTLKKLYVMLSDAPGDGKSYTIKPRVNGADSGLAVTISNTDTTGNDTSNTKELTAFDDLTILSTPASNPTASKIYWGLVGSLRKPKRPSLIKTLRVPQGNP